MTKQSPIPAPRLYRPTLPFKKALEPRVWCKPKRLGEYINLSTSRDAPALAKCLEKSLMRKVPKAILVAESSDDERRTRQDSTSSTRSSFSMERRSDADIKGETSIPPMTRTGVFYENVEIQSDMHPLQSCCAQDRAPPHQARHTVKLPCGVPLAAAPKLPRHQSTLRPLPFPTSLKRPRTTSVLQDSSKKQRNDVLQESGPRFTAERVTSRAAEVKEASFMIEAAVALSKLHSAKAN